MVSITPPMISKSTILPQGGAMDLSTDGGPSKISASIPASIFSKAVAPSFQAITSTPFSAPVLMPQGLSVSSPAAKKFLTLEELQKEFQAILGGGTVDFSSIYVKVLGIRFKDAKRHYLETADTRMNGFMEEGLIKDQQVLNLRRFKVNEYKIEFSRLLYALSNSRGYTFKHKEYPCEIAKAILVPHFKAKIEYYEKLVADLTESLIQSISQNIKELEERIAEGEFLFNQAVDLNSKLDKLRPSEGGLRKCISDAAIYYPTILSCYKMHLLESRQYLDRLLLVESPKLHSERKESGLEQKERCKKRKAEE